MARATPATIASRGLAVLTRVVDPLTAGQRWTAGLMAGLAVVVLAFGMPTRALVPSAAPFSPAGASSGDAAGDGGPSSSTAAPRRAPAGDGARTPERVGTTGGSPAGQGPVAVSPPGSPTPSGAARPGVVAVVDPEATGDRGMAQRFLGAAGLDVVVVALGDVAATCAEIPAESLVVSSYGLPAAVRSCVEDAGGRTLSWDDAPDPAGPSVSTRRGAARSLLDTAEAVEVEGTTALVADERLRPVLEPAIAAAAEAGLEVAHERWLTSDADAATAALALAPRGVETVLFATSVARQSVVASQLRLFSPTLQVLVLDAADAVVDGTYPATFDGTRAVTSIRHPWDPGSSELRESCMQRWTGGAPDPLEGPEVELRVLLWCQHADLAAELAEAGAPTGEQASPVTSPLGALPDGGFGPTQTTTVAWTATCTCWGEPARAARTRGWRSARRG